MTTSVVSKTFLGNNAAFINRKNSSLQWTVISIYVLKLRGDDWLCFKNSCSLCCLFTSVSLFLLTIIITPARLLTELRKGSSSISLPQMQKSSCAYVPSSFLSSLLSACATKTHAGNSLKYTGGFS